ncbi:MAG: DUF2339 domain-containing protein [Candidatus Omnitrophota bacterium]|jgi:hypothetical protein
MLLAFTSIFFSFWGIMCVATALVAVHKKKEVVPWILISILIGPFALLLVALLPKNELKESIPLGNTPASLKLELANIKVQLNLLLERLRVLELKINEDHVTKETPVYISKEEPVIQTVPFKPRKEVIREKRDVEANIGKYWLNKIGIILFSLGIAFLITYTFKYFGPVMRIMFGYVVCAGLFFLGSKLEKKEKFANYGRIILGGAWAIVYFTTYAMYHFQASKIINSRFVDLLLLGIVSLGILAHSLKYRSQALSAMALFVGYFTATMGDVSYFTFISCCLLAIVALVLVYKMQWIKFIFAGIVLTYITHFFWVTQHIYLPQLSRGMMFRYGGASDEYFLISAAFLSIYWLLFSCGIHLIKDKAEADNNKLAIANFFNAFLFFFMVYPRFSQVYPDSKFLFMFGIGALYLTLSYLTKRTKSNKLFTSDIITALSFLTLSVPLKLIPFYTSLVWMFELPFLLALGIIFERRAIRYFVLTLTLFLFLKLVFLDFFRSGHIYIVDFALEWADILSLAAFLSMAACFYLTRFFEKGKALVAPERSLYNIFSALATLYLTVFIWRVVDLEWLTLGLAFETLAMFYLGILFWDKYLRVYAFTLLSILFFRFCFITQYNFSSNIMNWAVSALELVLVYAVYFLYRSQAKKKLIGEGIKPASVVVFWAATLMSICTISRYVDHSWISLGLVVAGVVMFAAGFLIQDKIFRWAGLGIFALTVMRVIFIDLSMLSVIYKIISFIIIGILFLGISYIYTRNIDKLQK